MELAALFFLAFAVVFAITSWTDRSRSNLEAVARKFDGVVTPGWFSPADVELRVDGVPARLKRHPGSKRSPPYTRLRFLHPLGTRLRVVPGGFWETLRKVFWSEDLAVGDPAFDRDFVVQGHPTSWVRAVLDASTRARIKRVSALAAGFLRGPSITFEAGPTGILVSVPRDLVRERASLEVFVAEAVALFRALRNAPSEGIEFVPAEQAAAKGNCPVCEHPLGERPRRCPACATPHHADCWAYFGGCSTYACRENP